jgi:hypothetical protein
MKPNPLRANWELVRLTESTLRHGTAGLGNLPGMIKKLLAEKAWRSFQLPSGESVTYERFTEFVGADPPRGLGTDAGTLENICHDDANALRELRKATVEPKGRPSNGHNITIKPKRGTGKSYLLVRLERERPDLHELVLVGKVSAHAAGIAAGFVPRTATVPIDNPERLAATLRRRLDPDMLARLRELLD